MRGEKKEVEESAILDNFPSPLSLLCLKINRGSLELKAGDCGSHTEERREKKKFGIKERGWGLGGVACGVGWVPRG